jgi:adenine-specific DNA-methyltransferase
MFPNEPVFDTPKPESLVRRILEIATNPGDLVLDAYMGSGTTAAVAHKLNRRYLGIEEGSQAVAFSVARLRHVISGEEGGISKDVNWNGGGGFKFLQFRGCDGGSC